jgi:hypothetical protein
MSEERSTDRATRQVLLSLQVAGVALYMAAWIAVQVGIPIGDVWGWLAILVAIVLGALIGRWWVVGLSFVPVVLAIDFETGDPPAWASVLTLYWPSLALAFAVGVGGAQVSGYLRRRFRRHAGASDRPSS